MTYRATLFALSQIRKLSTSTSHFARKNHYESLGLAKGATQADIKGAYYELSKVYHPDKNQGHTSDLRDQHSQKFRDITEAYEVLGNAKTRKMYDKGFMGMGDNTSTHTTHPRSPPDPLHNFYKSRETRHRYQADGKTPIYDFDEWSKKHYGDVFRRKQDMKHRHAFRAKIQADFKQSEQYEHLVMVGLLCIGLCALVSSFFKSQWSIFFGIYSRQDDPNKKYKDTNST